MAPLSAAPSDGDGWALNGSLAQPHHTKAKQLLRTLICSKQKVILQSLGVFKKGGGEIIEILRLFEFIGGVVWFCVAQESLMEVSRSLLECLSQEGLSVKLSGKLARPSAVQLKTFIQQFKSVSLLSLCFWTKHCISYLTFQDRR